MDQPALKVMSQKQLNVKYILEDMLGYAIRRAREARYLRVSDEDAVFTIMTPEMGTKDIAKMSTAAQQIGTALVSAEVQGWLIGPAEVFASVVAFTGVDMNLKR